MAAHSIMADLFSKVPVEITQAIRSGTEIPDKKLRALSMFSSVMLNKRGNPSMEDVAAFLNVGYNELQIRYIISGPIC